MANRLPTLPQPPIVWGPSEIDEWIRGAFPSGSRGPPGLKGAKRFRRLAVKVWADSLPSVRARVVAVLGALGYHAKDPASLPVLFAKGERTILVRFLPSLLGDAITVAASFDPPAVYATPNEIASGLAEQFPLGKVTMTEAAPRKVRRSSAKR